MKEYKTVILNRKLSWKRDSDIEQIDTVLNTLAAEGWELVQAVSPNDHGGSVYGIFAREKK